VAQRLSLISSTTVIGRNIQAVASLTRRAMSQRMPASSRAIVTQIFVQGRLARARTPIAMCQKQLCMPATGLGDISLAAVLAGAQLDAGVELRQGSIWAQIRDAVDFHFHARFDHAGLYRRARRESAAEKSSVGGVHRRKVVTRLDEYGTLDDIGY
jgi:hypothetical protein